MTPELYRSYDTSLIGEAELILRDPRIFFPTPTPADVFDSTDKEQTWRYPDGTKDVDAFDFARNEDGTIKIFSDNQPRLVEYYISPAISTKTNIQTNPSKDGFVARSRRPPLTQPAADEKLVFVRRIVGGLVVDGWWIRRGDPVPAPPPTGDVFTEQDRAVLNQILAKVSR